MNDEFKNRIKSLSDEELLKMINENADDYTEEAVEIARQEVEVRGGIDTLTQKVTEQQQKVEQEEERRLRKEEELQAEARRREAHAPRRKGLLSETRTLKDETVGTMSQRMIPGASGNSDKVLDIIQGHIEASDMPLDCRWGVVEVKTKHFISRVRRDFLIVESEEFPDHHAYISIRDFGMFLDCVLFFTVEPGALKKFLSKKLTGSEDEEALSRPKNILKLQDFNAWKLIVKSCFDQAVNSLVEELGKKPGDVLNRERTFLDIW